MTPLRLSLVLCALTALVACSDRQSPPPLIDRDAGSDLATADVADEDSGADEAPADVEGACQGSADIGHTLDESTMVWASRSFASLTTCPGDPLWFGVVLAAGDTVSFSPEVLDGDLSITLVDRYGEPLEGEASGIEARRDEAVYALFESVAGANLALDITIVRGPSGCIPTAEEPNGSAEEAFALGDLSSMSARVCPDDEDWYAIDVPAGDTLTARITFEHAEGDLDMIATLGDETELARSESTADIERVVVGPFPDSTTVFVKIYGYRNADNTYALATWLFEPAALDATLRGRVTYEDRLFDAQGMTGELAVAPLRRGVVEVVRELDGATVCGGVTDEDGAFEIACAVDADQDYHVRALASVRVGGYRASTRDRSDARAIYALVSPTLDLGASAQPLEMTARADEAIGGAMNIVDVAGLALALIDEYSDGEMPPLDYSWQPAMAHACGSCYLSGSTIDLGGQLDDPDEYDDAIIIHELGHYFVDHLSLDSSPGGSHRGFRVSPLLAYGEGVAYFWAAMVLEDPLIVDTFIDSARAVDLEEVTEDGEFLPELAGTSDGGLTGKLREEVVAAIMWDALDDVSEAEPFDTVDIGVAGNMHILLDYFGGDFGLDLNVPGVDLVDWLNAAACYNPELGTGLDALAADRDFPWSTEMASCTFKGDLSPFELRDDGSGELNLVAKLPAATPTKLQVWTQLSPNAPVRKRATSCKGAPCPIMGVPPRGTVAVTGLLGGKRFGASWTHPASSDEFRGGQPRTGLSHEGIPLRLFGAR